VAWAAINLAGAVTALSTGGLRAADQAEARRRLVTLQSGMFSMTLFGFGYERTVGRRKRERP